MPIDLLLKVLKKRLLPVAVVALFGAVALSGATAQAADEFTDLQCLFDVKSKFPCNVSFFKKWMKIYFPRTGRTSEKIKYRNILRWNYSDASLKKPDIGLAARIGIVGLLFKKVEHQHVFTIVYEDDFGDERTAILDFDDKQFVQPIKAALADATEVW